MKKHTELFSGHLGMLGMLEPVFKTKTLKLYEMQPKQIDSQRISKYTQQSKAVLIFLLKWGFPSHCAQEQLDGKMEETYCTLSPLRSKLET